MACIRCGRETEGRNYSVHYGWKAAQSSKSARLGTATVSRTTTRYSIGGADSVCLCNRCVRRLNLPMTLGIFLVTLFLGLWLVSAHMPWVVIGGLLLLAAAGALINVVSTKVSVSDGEEAACKWARKQHLHGADTVFWTPKEFTKLEVQS